jgi:acetolactate synthase-1/3 small subunit
MRIIMKYTLIAWMRDKPGVLNRVAGMLRRRNFNIDSLQVGHSETPGISRMTFVVDGNERMVDQVIKQMRKIMDVTRVEDISGAAHVAREMALIRVATNADNRSEIVQLVNIYRGEIVDVALDSDDRADRGQRGSRGFAHRPAGQLRHQEMVRTGAVAMVRGQREARTSRGTAVWRAQANGKDARRWNASSTGGV